MVDWVTARLPVRAGGELHGGQVIAIRPNGEVEWRTLRRLSVEGSHSAVVQVRGCREGLELSGNPAKYLQGHNVFGSDDLPALTWGTIERVSRRLGLPVEASEAAAIQAGDFDLTRLDVTRGYDLGSAAVVQQWLTVASAAANAGHQRVTNPSAFDGGTLYVGQKSRRISLKLYGKGAELARHGLPVTLTSEVVQLLTEVASKQLRAEVTIRGMELKQRGLRRADSWSPEIAEALIDERLGKLNVLDALRLGEDELLELPRKLVPVYRAWLAGDDLRTVYSRPTFYRYRRELLAYGIDIRNVRPRLVVPETEYAMGRPMRDFIAGRGEEPPAWARGTELLYGT